MRNDGKCEICVLDQILFSHSTHTKTNSPMLKLHFYTQLVITPTYLDHILITFREILSINTAYIII